MTATTATAKAPSSTANLGPGFDVFGLAIDAFYDRVTMTRSKKDDRVRISMTGGPVTGRVGNSYSTGGTIDSRYNYGSIPTKPKDNTAGLVVENMRQEFGITDGINVRISKGVPAGFGMGSSAASAAAAAVAFNKLYGLNLDRNALVEFAGSGEKASAGSVHYDNVAASVLGGFVVVRTNPLDVIKIRPPPDLSMCVAVPEIEVPKKKTKISRGAIPKKVSMTDSVANLANASRMVVGFMKRDSELIGGSVRDVIVEPAREHMIPGFAAVKKAAQNAGALGVTISGAGPSVIAFSTDAARNIKRISNAMSGGFSSAGIVSRTIICKPSRGAASVVTSKHK